MSFGRPINYAANIGSVVTKLFLPLSKHGGKMAL